MHEMKRTPSCCSWPAVVRRRSTRPLASDLLTRLRTPGLAHSLGCHPQDVPRASLLLASAACSAAPCAALTSARRDSTSSQAALRERKPRRSTPTRVPQWIVRRRSAPASNARGSSGANNGLGGGLRRLQANHARLRPCAPSARAIWARTPKHTSGEPCTAACFPLLARAMHFPAYQAASGTSIRTSLACAFTRRKPRCVARLAPPRRLMQALAMKLVPCIVTGRDRPSAH